LILNPDFEQGYFGFTSDFGRGVNNATRNGCNVQGWIVVTRTFPHGGDYACQIYPGDWSPMYGPPNTETPADPNHPANTSVITTANCTNTPLPDHTSGLGNYLTIDPDAAPGRSFWKQNVQICPRTNYVFSVWVRNISGFPAPTFHFEVGGVPINAPTVYPLSEWTPTQAVWNSGLVDGLTTIELVNDQPGCFDNDVGIDDLFFGVCGGVLNNGPGYFAFCPDDAPAELKLSGQAIGWQVPAFQWQFRPANGGGWTDIPGATDSVLTLKAPWPIQNGWYRLTAAEQGNLGSVFCRSEGPAIQVVVWPAYETILPVTICYGEQYEGYGSSGRYTERLASVNGCDSVRILDLTVLPESLPPPFIPTVFQPESGDENAFFKPFFEQMPLVYRLELFDRWGSLVFRSTDPDAAWDGATRGRPCPEGVYFYALTTEWGTCHRGFWKGSVTIIR
jgi:gliding motility-associated-like protein